MCLWLCLWHLCCHDLVCAADVTDRLPVVTTIPNSLRDIILGEK
jgi:hypothetical protein